MAFDLEKEADKAAADTVVLRAPEPEPAPRPRPRAPSCSVSSGFFPHAARTTVARRLPGKCTTVKRLPVLTAPDNLSSDFKAWHVCCSLVQEPIQT
jgi:hypothetical protein